MKKFYVRLLIIVLGIGFCIFFGVDMATRGVERIQGPVAADTTLAKPWQPASKQQETKLSTPTPKPLASAAAKEQEKAKEQVEPPEPRTEISKASGINRLGNKIGELLQIIAYHGIKWFVALFDTIT